MFYIYGCSSYKETKLTYSLFSTVSDTDYKRRTPTYGSREINSS
jgi:hypothetical protein